MQEALLTIRDIYHWQDPPKTSRYLTTYFVLWLFNYLAPFAVSGTFYSPLIHGA
jgi:hypothetical protein